jgi:hypothetical protein
MCVVYSVFNPRSGKVLAACGSLEEAHAERVRLVTGYRYQGLRIRKSFFHDPGGETCLGT